MDLGLVREIYWISIIESTNLDFVFGRKAS
jgi:hypothetical protein